MLNGSKGEAPGPRRRLGRIAASAAVVAASGLVGLAALASATTGSGSEGQTIVVSKTEGLNPSGETITVHGEGFDLGKGIYVVLCVNNGAGQQPTPCLGGADMEGAGGASVWVSSNPPSYGEGLTTPFTEAGGKGSFDVQLSIAAQDQFTNCLDAAQAPNGCVVGTRADHTRTGDRSADVFVPVTFAASGAPPSSTPSPVGGGASPSPSNSTKANLARTGSDLTVPAAAAVGLIAVGAGASLAVRRRRSSIDPAA